MTVYVDTDYQDTGAGDVNVEADDDGLQADTDPDTPGFY